MATIAGKLDEVPIGLRSAECYQRVPWGERASGFQGGFWSLMIIAELFTDLMIRMDGDNGLLRRYESVDLTAPVHGGEYLRFRTWLVGVGETSRTMDFAVDKELAEGPEGWPNGQVLDPAVRVMSGRAICVVPKANQRPTYL